jgi:hypothetical protein
MCVVCYAAQWISTLETYVFPTLGNRKLDAVTPALRKKDVRLRDKHRHN